MIRKKELNYSDETSKLHLVDFDIVCLNKSWEWLSDPGLRQLTLSPEFTREEQLRFYDSIKSRDDYNIWGVFLDGFGLIGVAGLKNCRLTLAEYWGYIGERNLWGKGLGKRMISIVEEKAKGLGFTQLELKVSITNERAIALYKKTGFTIDPHGDADGCLRMYKSEIE